MAADKNSFILYCDLIHTIDKLSNEQAGQLLKFILAFVNDQNPIIKDQVVDVVFEPIKGQLKRDLKKWEREINKRSESGIAGNIKRWHKNVYKEYSLGNITLDEAKERAFGRKSSHPDPTPSDPIAKIPVNDNVNVTDIYNNIKHLNYLKNNRSDYTLWLDGISQKHRLRNGRIWQILEKFCNHLRVTEKVHSNIKSFKTHFVNWLDKQDQHKMLENFKERRAGAL